MSTLQRILLVLIGLLAAGTLLLAVWLAQANLFGTSAPASKSTAAVSDPPAAATALPEPLEHTAPAPLQETTPTEQSMVEPADESVQACLPTHTARDQGRVLEVLAVNRIRVEVEGQEWEVLYLGVDPAGAQAPALAANQALIEGQTVTLIQDGIDMDSQGVRLRYVLVEETLVNFVLIREGMAITALYPPGIACDAIFLAGERAAQAERVGFWAMPIPTQDPAVLTTVAVPPCACNTTFTCADFSRREAAQACYNACGDYRNAALDDDHDGLACEDLP
jgi:hypothetical protein